MFKRTYTFDLETKNMEFIQKKIKHVLQFMLNFNTRTLSTISFIDKKFDIKGQEDNKILIRQENDKIFVQINGLLTEDQINILSRELDKIIGESEKKEKIKPTKNGLVDKIIKRVVDQGYNINTEDARKFIINFRKKFNRLPEVDEIESIGFGYIMMLHEEMSKENYNYETAWNELLSEEHEHSLLELSSEEHEHSLLELSSDNGEKTLKEAEDKITPDNGVLEIKKQEGRLTCPKCGNQYRTLIRELQDKNNIISNYPRMYGKKYECGKCGTEWKKELNKY